MGTFLVELNNREIANEKSDKLLNLCNEIRNNKDCEEVHKLFEKNLSSEKEFNKKLISALIERFLLDSIEHSRQY